MRSGQGPDLPVSGRLGFRAWREDDLTLAMALWGDARVTRYIVAGGTLTPDEVRARLREEISLMETHGVQYWPLSVLADGRFVGVCGLRPCPGKPGTLEFGAHLVPGEWGRGFATEAGRAVVDFAFGRPGVEKLFAGHHPEIERSGRLLKKLGFRYAGRELYGPTGLMHPSYELTRPR